MGANTYRLMSGFAAGETPEGTDEFSADEEASVGGLTGASKVVFSSSLEEPLTWANSTLVRDDAVDAVRAMKEEGSGLLSTIGSLSLCRSLLRAGLVDRFRVVMFPVITGATGAERIYDGYPDVALDMIDQPNLRRPHPTRRVPAPRTRPPTSCHSMTRGGESDPALFLRGAGKHGRSSCRGKHQPREGQRQQLNRAPTPYIALHQGG